MTSTVLRETTREVAPSVAEVPDLEVVVLGATSPLETGSLFGRGHGVLAGDRSLAITFLLGHQEFVSLRDQVLSGAAEISITVRATDVTAIERRGGVGVRPAVRPFA